MDSRLIYTRNAEALWERFRSAARERKAVTHGQPPELAIELSDARLYVTEAAAGPEVPAEASRLGPGVRAFLIDIHNHRPAEAFLADVLDQVEAVVDDDHGVVTPSDAFVAHVRARARRRS